MPSFKKSLIVEQFQGNYHKFLRFEERFRKERFRDRLVWTVGLTTEIKLRSQISPARPVWIGPERADQIRVIQNKIAWQAVRRSETFSFKDVRAHCYCASLVRTLFIGHARATSFLSARTESKTQQNIELMTFALTWCANIFCW